MSSGVFLDRDGTLIEDRGDIYDPADVVFFDNTFEALLILQRYFQLFIVTNQSGVAKGTIKLDQVNLVNAHIVHVLAEHGIKITDT